jgi:FAD/FMN-containing dehydrogenase
MIARCATADDVAAALALARQHDLDLAVRSGGHCFAKRSTSDGVLIDVTPMDAIAIDGDRVTVGAGVRLGRLIEALAARGAALPTGCGDDVGVAGLTLGGGIGVLGRRYGLTCDRVRAATVVLADGRAVECDAEHNADLFWALRGAGGGQFGVVTSFTFETVRAHEMTCFRLTWRFEDAAAVVGAWQAWAPDAPDEVTASLLVTAGATPLSVDVFGAAIGDVDLDGLPAPASAWFERARYGDAKGLLGQHAPNAEPPARYRSEFFARPLPHDAIGALLEAFTSARGERELDFMPWGGSYARVAPDATAFAHRAARFLLKPGGDDAGWVSRAYAITQPYGTGGVYPNFPDLALDDPLRAYHGANLERLEEVKARYDPENVFAFEQSITARARSSAPR